MKGLLKKFWKIGERKPLTIWEKERSIGTHG
jgi:hypothetical protein